MDGQCRSAGDVTDFLGLFSRFFWGSLDQAPAVGFRSPAMALAPRLLPALRASFSLMLAAALAGCGGTADTARRLDESEDIGGGGGTSGGGSGRTAEMPTGLGGTEWHFVEASCTEGPLDLSSRGFASRLRVEEDGPSLLLFYSHNYASEGCDQTIVQRVSPPTAPGELAMEEIARLAVPSTPECFGQPEAPRPGEVIHEGRRLEVLVQRSRWCGGFEVRFTYEQEMPRLLTPDEIVRLYAVHYSLGNADRIADMFANAGSLLEPFTRTATGDPYRHDGREAVRTWYRESFASSAWRALRIVSIEAVTERQVSMRWEYMDPRLAVPVSGQNLFTVAAGEIFESQITIDGAPVLVPPITP